MSYIGQFKKKVIGNLRSVGTWVKMSLYCTFPSKGGECKSRFQFKETGQDNQKIKIR